MKDSRLSWHTMIKSVITLYLMYLTMTISAESRQEMKNWTYHKERDNSTNVSYSLARSPIPRRGKNDPLRLEIVCKNNTLFFAVDSYDMITSKGSAFDFDYRIDNNDPVTMTLHTYRDTKRRGFTDQSIDRIVADMLSGQSMFIRVHTLIRRVLSSAIPLPGSEQPIRQVFADCGKTLAGEKKQQGAYRLSDLQQDLEALPPGRRRQALEKIREILEQFR